MRGARVLIALTLLFLTVGPGLAEAPGQSLVPPARPGNGTPAALPSGDVTSASEPPNTGPASAEGQALAPAPQPAATQIPPRPKARPTVAPAPQTPPAQLLNSHPAPDRSPLPMPRPGVQAAAASPAKTKAAAAAPAAAGPKVGHRGAVCGDSALTGTVLAPITSRVKGCGIAAPVALDFVAGVRLNPPATIDCTTAEALKTWVKKGLQPAFSPRKVVELEVFGSYACRPRNNVRGAKLSEHGKGKAIDIGAFVLDNGQTWTVLDDYNKPIRKAQRAACGPFSTTLGPGSDGFHENHLHFDTASYGYGPYCH